MSHCNYKQKTQNQNNEKIPKTSLSLRMPQSNSYSASRALRRVLCVRIGRTSNVSL